MSNVTQLSPELIDAVLIRLCGGWAGQPVLAFKVATLLRGIYIQSRFIHHIISMENANARGLITPLQMYLQNPSKCLYTVLSMDLASMNGHVDVLDPPPAADRHCSGQLPPWMVRPEMATFRFWTGGSKAVSSQNGPFSQSDKCPTWLCAIGGRRADCRGIKAPLVQMTMPFAVLSRIDPESNSVKALLIVEALQFAWICTQAVREAHSGASVQVWDVQSNPEPIRAQVAAGTPGNLLSATEKKFDQCCGCKDHCGAWC
ncbi:hypothetical protein BJ742DRAFT_857067 [Cladochytrium replicatum]|nr:hypothetical protein BJ742DRAFT_857067 [Cladochytrium replicatum]